MKREIKMILKSLLTGVVLLGTAYAEVAKPSGGDNIAKKSLIRSAYRCNIAAETLANSYLYIGEAIGARQAKRELEGAIKLFNKNYKLLSKSINEPNVKNLLTFVKMSYDELEELLKEPYNLDNAQIVLDLVGTISEGTRHIAEQYKEEIGHKNPVSLSGLIPMIESISKYYIAYQAGIKDENTISLMKKTVALCAKQINARVKYSSNTVAMNQTINKVETLWKIVDKFYLDIDKGGLPFIVFKTTTKLKDELKEYNDLQAKQKVSK